MTSLPASAAETLASELREFRPSVDDREHHTLGWRMADAELAGYPLRIEFGPRELKEGMVTLVRRDTLEKKSIPRANVVHAVREELIAMHQALYAKAARTLHDSRVETQDFAHKVLS